MRDGVGQALDELAGAAHERERGDQLRGDVGAELRRELLEVADLTRREAEDGGGVGAAATEARGDRDLLIDLDPQRRPRPAPGAQALTSARAARFSPPPSASHTTVSLSASSTRIRSARRQRLEQRAELVQAVEPDRPEVKAEIELGRGVDHRSPSFAASAANSSGASASARASAGRPISSSASRAASILPGRTCSRERGSDLRRWAKAARISSRVGRFGPGPGAAEAEDRRLDPRPGAEDGRIDGPHQPDIAGELGDRARRAVGPAPGPGPQPQGERLRLGARPADRRHRRHRRGRRRARCRRAADGNPDAAAAARECARGAFAACRRDRASGRPLEPHGRA